MPIDQTIPDAAPDAALPKTDRQLWLEKLRNSPDDFLTLNDVSRLLGISRTTLWRWQQGEAPVPSGATLPRPIEAAGLRFLVGDVMRFYDELHYLPAVA